MDDAGNHAREDSCPYGGFAALNDKYAVFQRHGTIFIEDIDSPDDHPGEIQLGGRFPTHPILAVPTVDPNLLAVADGTIVKIFDLQNAKYVATLPGNNRIVTALTWAGLKCVVATIDGSITVWKTQAPAKQLQRWQTMHGPYQHIASSFGNEDVISTLSKHEVRLWRSTHGALQCVASLATSGVQYDALAWRPMLDTCTIAVAFGHRLTIYDTTAALRGKLVEVKDGWESEDEILGHFEESGNSLREVACLTLECPLETVSWIDETTILGLAEDGKEAARFALDALGTSLTLLSITNFKHHAAAVHAEAARETTQLLAVTTDGLLERHPLPALSLQCRNRLEVQAVQESRLGDAHLSTTSGRDHIAKTMRPLSIPANNMESASKTAGGISKRGSAKSMVAVSSEQLHSPALEDHAPLQLPSMTSSLELPKLARDEDGSPMPFLSPSIPARMSPQTVIASLEDSILDLPPLPDSYTSPAPNLTSSHDDESDDETFAEGLRSSGIFMPGGVNVPLPKACGALFAPNGQLLTFFPAKPRTLQQDLSNGGGFSAQPAPERAEQEVAALFPAFGNLLADQRRMDSDTETLASNDSHHAGGTKELWPGISVFPSSFPSQHSHHLQSSPVKFAPQVEQQSTRIEINIHQIEADGFHTRTERQLATQYRQLKLPSEPGSTVCRENARCASEVGMKETALIWQLLALLLEETVPLSSLHLDGHDDVLLVAQQVSRVLQAEASYFGRLRWSGDPLGSSWLVRKIFDWAEARADVQLLACMAVILAEPETALEQERADAETKFVEQLPGWSLDYMSAAALRMPGEHRASHPIPALQTSSFREGSATVPITYQSPFKYRQPSNTSSRTTSQLTTPYLESTSSTPPFSLPTMSRQGSHLSASGSASPEAHRSSFSAAAKHYAQSITDKFAAYSAYSISPPLKKSSTSVSPSNNELSTSLPNGSWSKSVSFATSTASANTARGSLLSRSFDEYEEDEANDSDKTIEDSTLPNTPRSPSAGITVTFKNQLAFADNMSGGAKQPLLPEDVAMKARHWWQHYAELLRSWGMALQAAELEKATGFAMHRYTDNTTSGAEQFGPSLIPQSNVEACSICGIAMRSIEQVCTVCLHASHLTCLSDYVTAVKEEDAEEEDFTCPTGCGCSCAGLPSIIQEVQAPSPETRPVFKKKPSFTDPRRWRARVQGDSW